MVATCKNRKNLKPQKFLKIDSKIAENQDKKSKKIRRKSFNAPNKNQEILNKKHGAATRVKTLFISGKDVLNLLVNQCSTPSGSRLFHIKSSRIYHGKHRKT